MSKVDMNEIIKVSPSEVRPYPQMKCVIGGPNEKYFEEITRRRALAILDEGFPLNLIKGEERIQLTKDYLLNTPTEDSEDEEEHEDEAHTEEPVEEEEKTEATEETAPVTEKKKEKINPLKK